MMTLLGRRLWKAIDCTRRCVLQRSYFGFSGRSHVRSSYNLNLLLAPSDGSGASNRHFTKLQSRTLPTDRLITDEERVEYDAVFTELVKALSHASKNDVHEIKDWFFKVLDYNIRGGKSIRGTSAVFSYKRLSNDLSDENIKLCYVLGWCVEMLQGFFLVIDDIMDSAETRRGLPAWYKREEVGSSMAINDGLLIESGIFKLLKIYFGKKPYYLNLVELFHDTTMKTFYGQGLDLMTSRWGLQRDFSRFTTDRHTSIIKYKTAYYTCHLPVTLALYMSGISDEKIIVPSKNVLVDIGTFFQVQDDYIDCFGDKSKMGKMGTDIKEGKCTWLAVHALRLANPSQFQTFRDNYGSGDQAKIDTIKNLYEELKLPEVYKEYEENYKNKIIKDIHDLKGVPHDIYEHILNFLYKRQS